MAGLRPLIGRDGELVELRGRLAADRMVTVTGAGGVGKTRLALAALERSRGALTTVELSAVSAPDQVASATR